MNRLNYEKVFKTLVEETGNYLVNHSLRAMVLGVSGGIDSTVVAAICCEVNKQTNIPLIGRSLPIKNKKDEFDVSTLVGEAFCNNFDVANLYDEYKHFLSGLVWREERIDLLDDTETMHPEKSKQQTLIANGLGIYGTEIDDNLNFKGVAGTADNFYQIISEQFGNIVADDSVFLKGFRISDVGNVYLKGEMLADPLDYLNVEQPKSYFY